MAAAFGLLFGLPSVRTRGEYLAIVTLAFGEMVPLVIWHLPQWTGGPRGMSGIPPIWPAAPGPASYGVALVLAIGVCIAAIRLARSRVGRAWSAVREDDAAAGAVGVDPPRYKLLAFALGAACAGMAGAVFAQLFGYIEPSQFDLRLSLMVLAAVVVGARWGVTGAVLGALAIAAYDRLLVDALTWLLQAFGHMTGVSVLASADLRQQNFVIFGVALLWATLLRGRRSSPQSIRRRHPAASACER